MGENKGVITDPVIHSMGLKMECNTRRFVTDDKRELQYRVEVQNRVYKKEMAALDAEITKLEKMLENSSSTSSSNLSIPLPIRHELAVVNEYDGEPFNAKHSKPRTPSIGGGLPLLLLSVLPPVIPRASWPSAEHMTMTMRKSVTFSSEPQLEDSSGSGIVRLPAIDLLNLRLTHQQATAEARKGLLDRIIGKLLTHISYISFSFVSMRLASRYSPTIGQDNNENLHGNGAVDRRNAIKLNSFTQLEKVERSVF